MIYESDYFNGKRWNGKVIKYDKFKILESIYLNGEKTGKEKEYYENELEFEGEYL